jgi:phage FluMu protein Com
VIVKDHPKAFDEDHAVQLCDNCDSLIRQGLALPEEQKVVLCKQCVLMQKCPGCGFVNRFQEWPTFECKACYQVQESVVGHFMILLNSVIRGEELDDSFIPDTLKTERNFMIEWLKEKLAVTYRELYIRCWEER